MIKTALADFERHLISTMRTIEIRSLGIIAAMLGLAVTIIKWG